MKQTIVLLSVALFAVAACGGETSGSGAKIAPASNLVAVQREGGAEPAPEVGSERMHTGGGAQSAPPDPSQK